MIVDDEIRTILDQYGQRCVAAGTLTDQDMSAELDEASDAVLLLFQQLRAERDALAVQLKRVRKTRDLMNLAGQLPLLKGRGL